MQKKDIESLRSFGMRAAYQMGYDVGISSKDSCADFVELYIRACSFATDYGVAEVDIDKFASNFADGAMTERIRLVGLIARDGAEKSFEDVLSSVCHGDDIVERYLSRRMDVQQGG